MIRVYIPTDLQHITDGKSMVEARGTNVQGVIEELDKNHPGIASTLIDKDGSLNRNINLAVDGRIVQTGLYTKLRPDGEVFFFNVVTGG